MPLSNRTFGVEFEFYITQASLKKLIQEYPKHYMEHIRKEYDAWLARERRYFSTRELESNTFECWLERNHLKPDNTFSTEYFGTRFAYGFVDKLLQEVVNIKNWVVKSDGSITGGLPFEIITPILSGQDGLKQIYSFLKFIQPYGKTNQSCGQHVHVGIQDIISADPSWKKKVAIALLQYKTNEETFDSLVIPNRRGSANTYTKSVSDIDETIKNFAKANPYKSGDFSRAIHPDRYKKLNTHSIERHKTLEFRQMHGNLDYKVVSNWVRICVSFVDSIMDSKNKSYDKIHEILDSKQKDVSYEELKDKILNAFKESRPNNDSYVYRNADSYFGYNNINKSREVIRDLYKNIEIVNEDEIKTRISRGTIKSGSLDARRVKIRTKTDHKDGIFHGDLMSAVYDILDVKRLGGYIDTIRQVDRNTREFTFVLNTEHVTPTIPMTAEIRNELNEVLLQNKKDFESTRYVRDAKRMLTRLVAE